MTRALLRALALLTLLCVQDAQAYPVIIAAVANFATYESIAAAFWATVVVAAAYAYSDHQQRSAKRKAEQAARDQLQDRLVNIRSATAPRKLAMGTVRAGGAVLWTGSTGANKTLLHLVIELASHEIDGVERIFFDGEPIDVDANGYVITDGKWSRTQVESFMANYPQGQRVPMPADTIAGTVRITWNVDGTSRTSGSQDLQIDPDGSVSIPVVMPGASGLNVTLCWDRRIRVPVARVRWRLGGADDLQGDPELRDAYPGYAHRYAGIACLVCTFGYDPAIPGAPVVTARFRGAKPVDPRNPAAGERFSENPFVCAAWLAKHPLAGRLLDADINQEYLIASANAADTRNSYVVGGVLQARPLYTCGYVHYCDESTTTDSSLDALVEAAAGRKDWAGGELCFMAGVYTPVAGSITEDMISTAGESTGGSGTTIADAYNCVEGRYWAEDNNDELTDYPRIEPDTWILEDGGRHPKTINLEAVRHTGQAQHVVGVLMRDARQDDTLSLTLKPAGLGLQLFRTYQVHLPRFGVVAKQYILLKKRWTLEGGVQVSLKETGAAIFDSATGFPAIDYLPNSNLPKWSELPDVQITRIRSGDEEMAIAQDGTVITRMAVYWQPTGSMRVEAIEVQWVRAQAGEAWAKLLVPDSEGKAALDAVLDGSVYLVRIRTVGALAPGRWSMAGVHQVLGKEAPPHAVTKFSVVQQANATRLYLWDYPDPPRDLAGFDLRYVAKAAAGASPNWDQMISLAQPPARAVSIERSQPGPGDYIFAIAAVDTSGHASAPLFSDQTLQAPLPAGGVQATLVLAEFSPVLPSLMDYGQDADGVIYQASASGSNLGVAGGGGGTPWSRIERGAPTPWPDDATTWLAMTVVHDFMFGGAGVARRKTWRITLGSARSDGTIVVDVRRKNGATVSAWSVLDASSWAADGWEVRVRTTGAWLEDVRLVVSAVPV